MTKLLATTKYKDNIVVYFHKFLLNSFIINIYFVLLQSQQNPVDLSIALTIV
jgi:hypothetical protein